MTEQEIKNIITPLHGWCSPSKAFRLFQLVRDRQIKNSLEIGVYGGRSIIPMAIAHAKYGGHALGIDGFNHPNYHDAAGWEPIYEGTVKVLKEYSACTLKRINREEYLATNPSEKFGLIHVDGDHSTEKALEDLVTLVPLLEPDGILVIDDTDWSTVQAAIDQFGKLELLESHPANPKEGVLTAWGIYKYVR